MKVSSMRFIQSFSSPVCGHGVTMAQHKLMHSVVSLKSMLTTSIAKTRVFVRLLLNRNGVNVIEANNEQIRVTLRSTQTASNSLTSSSLTSNSLTESLIHRLLKGERNFVKHVVSRWVNNKSVIDLRRNAMIGSSGLSLGLVGVCVKRNSPTLITEQDEMESKCEQIRSVFKAYHDVVFTRPKISLTQICLDHLELGQCIAKGCNGVVYEARLKDEYKEKLKDEHEDRFNEHEDTLKDEYNVGQNDMNLAVKMLFNYEAESNADAIWRAMNKECITFDGDFGTHLIHAPKREKLTPHPNIIEIYGVFADFTPPLQDAYRLYPDALPTRFGGFARNMTLFVLEKRFDVTLKQYLRQEKPNTWTSTLMLTQLLEAVCFLVKNKVAHRDLKCDNILVDLSHGIDSPWLVVTDFGSCLTDLTLPFTSQEVCRGGNRALMSPEVICAQPGSFSTINYAASDLWAVGAIAYELYGGFNPFYPYPERSNYLLSSTYKETDLPELPLTMPIVIQKLVAQILKRNPNQRPDAKTAATVCHIVLHMTNRFLSKLLMHNKNVTKQAKELVYWLQCISISTMCKRKTIMNGELLSEIEMKLRIMLLRHVRIENLLDALRYFEQK